MAAHLAGVVAASTTLPVIGIPIKSTVEGMDALLATVMMPSGIPVATVAINGAKNAGYLAAEMIAISDPDLAGRLKQARDEGKLNVLKKNAAVEEKFNH
jgi:5-(carboxyamino)imidazole ribonucleotide mutase